MHRSISRQTTTASGFKRGKARLCTVLGSGRLTPSVKAEGGLAKSTLSKTVNALLGWLCYAHATSYDYKEIVGCHTCDEKAYDAAICILPFGMMSLYERQ